MHPARHGVPRPSRLDRWGRGGRTFDVRRAGANHGAHRRGFARAGVAPQNQCTPRLFGNDEPSPNVREPRLTLGGREGDLSEQPRLEFRGLREVGRS